MPNALAVIMQIIGEGFACPLYVEFFPRYLPKFWFKHKQDLKLSECVPSDYFYFVIGPSNYMVKKSQ